ncbi:MAG: hypothetical protein JXR83_21075 [Deltaproteobacteria bacterium]|nr:hypothetical protein [Deltaproteobacteria bacterium]
MKRMAWLCCSALLVACPQQPVEPGADAGGPAPDASAGDGALPDTVAPDRASADAGAGDAAAADAGSIDGAASDAAAADSGPAADAGATATGFKDAANWAAFEPPIADQVLGATAKGYYGAVFDGRFMYYVPCRKGNLQTDFHGVVMRYDTQGDFKSAASWAFYDAGNTLGNVATPTVGYAGGAFDGRYVYFVPYADGSRRHARVLRYDTIGAGFTAASSWSAFDAGTLANMPQNSGYDGAVYDGSRYLYFVPYGDQSFAHGFALRYDTTGAFDAPASWQNFYVGNIGGLTTKGYYGGTSDGRYLYFAPFNNGTDTDFHGNVLRFDTQGAGGLTTAANWSAHDASSVDGLHTVGYKGAVFDGRYVYFVPFRDNIASQHTRVLRYDTTAAFDATGAWDAFDASDIDGLVTMGYVGAEFDGRYVYFIPYQQNNTPFATYHANVLRLDTHGDFRSRSSWSAFDAGWIDGLKTKGLKYGSFDGSYVYFVPYNFNDDPGNNGHTTYSRRAVRYRIDPH